ncbi:penicillin-binding protein 1A [Noviherbaspirillum saxi]|uniref:Penicillin-binding protein 1A n=1 Tax=Noviherbaspirillum saxi TaxID=2320863 RepID=A0A3A3FMW5_9BURK|nr:penicillin-binding protein 1A [Noviherbaspirillum saxi]RJF96071.1 penicillin-binding protein 1A [Noviherbaspirillum saxi]
MPLSGRLLQVGAVLFAAFILVCLLVFGYVTLFVTPNLPSLDALIDYRPKIPLRVYTADEVLIGEFGEERRDFIPIAQMPDVMKKALLSIEDDRFYEHGGVDYIGVIRAGLANLRSSRAQGASTITMQVARTFFLSRQKTYGRKIHEIVLAYEIERHLTKDQILELYMNQIYLGERAYGFGSAARVYFGKAVKDLTIAEAAMLAGLPKAPAGANPIVNPTRAGQRQQYILKRMRELGYITPEQYARASQEKLVVRSDRRRYSTHAEHAAEAVRQYMYAQYKDDIYTHGYSVYTTLNSADQNAAYNAVRRGVMDYERRHGYRGPEAFIDLPADEDERQQAVSEALLKYPDSDELQSAVVTSASAKLVRADLLSGDDIEISGEGLRFASSALTSKGQNRIRRGAVIRVIRDAKKKWAITQMPEVSAAFVSLDAQDGSLRAMVGGFDFAFNQFDHVNQAWRQPGSTIKPFIYSAALEKGFSPGTLVNDVPLIINASETGGQSWEPQNDNGQYDGPVTMRTGLKRSKNLVSIRILQSITPGFAQQYLTRFGFDQDKHPANLTMTLGTGSVTPMQMARGYAVFANGGYQVTPFLIQKIVDNRGNVLTESNPVKAGDEANRVLDGRNAFIMDTMMRDVINGGTAFAASQKIGRRDLAGKTGTTNDAMDGWFAGYGGNTVGVAWMGYDKPRSLGGREFGGTVALPIWIDYMRTALKGKAPFERGLPDGIAQVEGDWMYKEYVNGNGVSAVGVEDTRGFWERLFGNRPAGPAPSPSTAPVQKPSTPLDDNMYRGGN